MIRSNNKILIFGFIVVLCVIGLAFYSVGKAANTNNEINIWGITIKTTAAYVVLTIIALVIFLKIINSILNSEKTLPTASHFLYINVHEEGRQTALIPKANVTLIVKPETKIETTDLKGSIKFAYSPIYEGQKAIVNAEAEGFEAMNDIKIDLKNERLIHIPLKKKNLLNQ